MKKKKRKYPELLALKGRLREKRYSYKKLAETMLIAPNTLCDKINGYYALTADEMEKMAGVLEIEVTDMVYYFFPNLLRNSTN